MSQADNWLPRHIGIIMDGNGRWAAQQGKPRSFGHRAGVNALREIIKHCGDLGIEYVTVYAFSTENFKRSSDEVGTLMSLLVEFLKNDLETIIQNGVRINVIGDIDAIVRSENISNDKPELPEKNGEEMTEHKDEEAEHDEK